MQYNTVYCIQYNIFLCVLYAPGIKDFKCYVFAEKLTVAHTLKNTKTTCSVRLHIQ